MQLPCTVPACLPACTKRAASSVLPPPRALKGCDRSFAELWRLKVSGWRASNPLAHAAAKRVTHVQVWVPPCMLLCSHASTHVRSHPCSQRRACSFLVSLPGAGNLVCSAARIFCSAAFSTLTVRPSLLLKPQVHHRAPPGVRGSGVERGHGCELKWCPKCGQVGGLAPLNGWAASHALPFR